MSRSGLNCYWAVIDAPGWRRPGQLPRHFAALLEEQIPIPSDHVQAVGVPCAGRAVVCAVPRHDLEQAPIGLLSLTPPEIPGSVREAVGIPLELAQFNLLVGAHEPAHLRASRKRSVIAAAVVALLFCGLLSAGFERRVAHWRAVDSSAREAALALRAQLDLPDVDDLSSRGVEVVSASVDSLKAVRRAVAETRPSPDAALALADLFRGWPVSDSSDTQSITTSDGVVTVSTAVRGDPRQFLDALRVPGGWSLDEPRLNSAGELTRLTITMRRTEIGEARP